MFYVKAEFKGKTIKVDLDGENIFTICPGCGVEHAVDIIGDPNIDLFGTDIYCEDCTEKRQNKRYDLDAWQPALKDEEGILNYLHRNVVIMADCCGRDGEETAEALELYSKAVTGGIDVAKDEIQSHFLELYDAVDGDLSNVSDDPHDIEIMKKVLGLREKGGSPT